MNVDGFVQAVAEDLAASAAIGDETIARAAALLTSALDSALRRRLQEALSEAALELSGQIAPDRVELRLAGTDLQLLRVAATEEPPGAAAGFGAGDELFSARITLRLPESLKARIEAAAVAAGVSLNSFVVQSLGQACEPRPSHHRAARRLSGYGRS